MHLRAIHIAVLLFGTMNFSLRADEPLDFTRDVAPILERHCLRCHRADNEKGDVSLATVADLDEAGYVVAGDPESSYLLDLVMSSADGERPAMPKEGAPLSPADVETIHRWIASGAVWPDDVVLHETSKSDGSWWSLQPIVRHSPPASQERPNGWAANPIDRFIFAKLVEKRLAPNPPADERTLIRRVTYDLTGLPPTPDEIAAFVSDDRPDAYKRLVDRLLASPHYGERWGRHWLDVVRFGESNGFERNVLINNVWPFRDYVVRSFNDDKPFDRLVKEHLAGDVIANGDPNVAVGTAFLVCGPYDNVGNQDAAAAAVIRADALDEMVRATGEAFLGLTVGCARCHDHKFDPIKAADYYALSATFAGVKHGERNLGNGMVWVGTFEEGAGPFRVFLGGDPQRKGDTVVPASLDVLRESSSAYSLPGDTPESQRRLALANWITAADNPLTPRVLANRVWHYHFGTGIVDTPSDFGAMGGQPSHPELLDWLAGELLRQNWRLKPLHRLIVTSQTYRQSAAFRPEAAAIDADARLLWRFPPRRLSGEEVRDTMLAVAGKLDDRMGGPGFRLYQYVEDNVATYVPLDAHGPETYRRAVYHQNARAMRVDVLTDFDCPDPAFAASRRPTTTTPLQALAMMNHAFPLAMADSFAARLQRDAGDDVTEQLRHGFRLAFGREPQPDEVNAAGALIESHGLRAFCRAVLNSNELVTVR
ncbi:MAG: PSD1 and planctomycete cytochrome C domain-containing protein [Planctomycetaceae bacterium]